jgi:hypothetical protein
MTKIEQLPMVLWPPVTMSPLLQVIANTSVRCKKKLGVRITTIYKIKFARWYLETLEHSRAENSRVGGGTLPTT